MADRQVVLLRGVNVGGHNRVPMAELAALLTELGCTDVRTFIQSGNAVVGASAALARRLPGAVAAAIEARLGLRVPVIVRSATALAAAVRDNPFVARGAEPSTLHIGFLAEAPSAAAIATLDPDRSPPDAFELRGRELYLCFGKGVATTRLTNAYFDRVLATTTTVRNWSTVNALVALATK